MRPETVCHRLAAGLDLIGRAEGVIAEPLVESDPVVRAFKDERVGGLGTDGASSRPPQEPVFAVGQDAHPHAAPGLLRCLEVAVELLDPAGLRLRIAGAALELHVGVERS